MSSITKQTGKWAAMLGLAAAFGLFLASPTANAHGNGHHGFQRPHGGYRPAPPPQRFVGPPVRHRGHAGPMGGAPVLRPPVRPGAPMMVPPPAMHRTPHLGIHWRGPNPGGFHLQTGPGGHGRIGIHSGGFSFHLGF